MPAAHCQLHRTMRTFIPAKQEFSSPLDRSKSPFHRFVAENWGPTFAHCHTSCPPAQPTPLLLTVAALRFPGTSCPPIAPLPRIALAPSATGGASGDSSKAGRFISLRQHFPAKHRPASRFSAPKGAENRGRSSKQARFFRRWRRFACFHITRWKTLCIMWKTSRYVILWKNCENFAHPLCTAKVL